MCLLINLQNSCHKIEFEIFRVLFEAELNFGYRITKPNN